ncbi:MAG: hypothetical protein AAGA73_09515 [Pseudomonadota bacterium]
MMLFRYALLVMIAVVLNPKGSVVAAELPSASGPVILTVTGKIEHTNRPAFNAFDDAFTNFHERQFQNAAEFDVAMLEGLGMREVEVNYEPWPRPVRLAGPLLADVLDLVGATPSSLTVLALDGFAVELSPEDLANEAWIVAIKQDGELMNIGQRGPVWVVFDPGEDKTIVAEEEGIWPWAAFFIEVN